jgi:hypothetical protein
MSRRLAFGARPGVESSGKGSGTIQGKEGTRLEDDGVR